MRGGGGGGAAVGTRGGGGGGGEGKALWNSLLSTSSDQSRCDRFVIPLAKGGPPTRGFTGVGEHASFGRRGWEVLVRAVKGI